MASETWVTLDSDKDAPEDEIAGERQVGRTRTLQQSQLRHPEHHLSKMIIHICTGETDTRSIDEEKRWCAGLFCKKSAFAHEQKQKRNAVTRNIDAVGIEASNFFPLERCKEERPHLDCTQTLRTNFGKKIHSGGTPC